MNDAAGTGWMRLDNAALIYPAARSKNWTALFRLSAQLTEPVDPDILAAALTSTLRRFPTFRKRLRRGLFWNYLEEINAPAAPEPDVANPCVRMDLKKNAGYMFRVRYHGSRIAVEIFHVLTDGTGGLCFLKTLTAEYLSLRYGAVIPRGGDVLDCGEPPRAEELEDSFARYCGREAMSREEKPAYCINGEHTHHFMHIITGTVPAAALGAKAAKYGVSVGELFTALLIMSVADVQGREKSRRKRRLPVKINVPVNLRRLFPSVTLRNFSSYVNPGIEPRYGSYTFEETLAAVKHFMGLELTEKRMNARFTANVKSQRNYAVRMAPLPIKHAVMKGAFLTQGDRYSSTTVSNLGRTELPEAMRPYVTRLDFMLGPLYRNPVTCACVTYNGQAVVNFTRTIEETNVERGFFTRLVRLGVPVRIESNDAEYARSEAER